MLLRTLESLAEQGVLPAELIVIDGSEDTSSRHLVERLAERWAAHCKVIWQRATKLGAAIQRNQGMALATQPVIWFFEDDILFEEDCVSRLWQALVGNERLGGVSAMIVNQRYHPPGRLSRAIFLLMLGRGTDSFAGKVFGPAVNQLPDDRADMPDVVAVEWLNLGCTLYRREALPDPPFDSVFTGYSMMEDLTLSLRVGKTWELANARTARIYHDSQPGDHKRDLAALAEMELVNRHFVMTEILGRRKALDFLRLAIWEAFSMVSTLRRGDGWKCLPRVVGAKCRGLLRIVRQPIGGNSEARIQPRHVKPT